MEILQTEVTPMGDNDIKAYCPSDRIFSYSQLADVNSIEELLPNLIDSCFILYEHSKNNGHWTCLSRYIQDDEPILEFFDSYGGEPDSQLNWTDKQTRMGLGITEPFLTNLMDKSGLKVIHNKKNYQKNLPIIATCGRWCVLRAKLLDSKNLILEEFHRALKKLKKKTGMNYDEIVSILIPK